MTAIPSWARKGARVTCIDDRWPGVGSSGLVKGHVYTIDAVHTMNGTGRLPDGTLSVGYALVELREASNPDDRRFPELERGFALVRFRPIVTRTIEQDAEIFAPLLDVRELVD